MNTARPSPAVVIDAAKSGTTTLSDLAAVARQAASETVGTQA